MTKPRRETRCENGLLSEYRDERKVVVSYVPYNEDFYAVFRNGRSEFVIHREQVENMLEQLAALGQQD